MQAILCANCEESIAHAPVYFDGQPFCCVGCVAGGPCTCSYAADTHEAGPAPARATVGDDRTASFAAALSPTAPAPRYSATPAVRVPERAPLSPVAEPPGREPIPFRSAGTSLILHITGFSSQAPLLAFAGVLEDAPSLQDVALTRVTDDEAWLTLRAPSARDAARTLKTLRDFVVEVFVDQNLIEARVTPASVAMDANDALDGLESEAVPGDEAAPLLPPRARFRVFRPEPASSPSPEHQNPASPPESAMPPQRQGPREPTGTSGAAQGTTPAPPVTPPRPTSPTPRPNASPAPTSGAPRRDPVAAPAKPAAPPPATADDFVEPEARPGGAVMTSEHMTLVVYPFQSFAALNDFQSAIRKIHGVKNTRVRRFYRGTLHLGVDYEDIIPLSERLHELKDFRFEIAAESRSEIELVLRETGSLAAAGGN